MPALFTVATVAFDDDHVPPVPVTDNVATDAIQTVEGPEIVPADTPGNTTTVANAEAVPQVLVTE